MEENKVQLMRRQKEEEATEQRARILGLTYLDTRDFEDIFPLARDLFTNEQMYRAFLAPLQIGDIDENKPWRVLITSLTPRSVIQKLSKKYQDEGKTLELFLVSESAWKNIMRRYDPPEKVVYDDIEIAGEGDSATLDKVSQTLANVASDQVFDYLIDQADRLGASDIHIENQRQTIRMYGVDAVMRLFNFDESMLQLDLLGIAPKERAEIDEIISHPRGMVLMVGPTGSGKSTTLYSMLNALNTLDRKIITLEDPIEYGIGGISQIPIDTTHGASFADGLRSVLRLDPDVVMVGEIRDNDTAKTAIQASITGHLVLSSFHANSTSAAFSRMIDMIGMNPIFSSAIRLLIAQRLVRKLDKNAKEYIPDEATKKWVRNVLEGVPAEKLPQDISGDFKLWKPVASEDSPFGYKGRIVVMEMMVVNDNIAAFLRGERGVISTEAIEAQARKDGLLTLLQQGVISALRGDTTIEEVNRVI